MKYGIMIAGIVFVCYGQMIASIETIADFDDLVLPAESYWNGSEGSGSFACGKAVFNNLFTDWGGGITSWEGFAYSNRTDTSITGFDGQYTAAVGSAHNGSNYAVGYAGFTIVPTLTLNHPSTLSGLYVSNNMYVDSILRQGDPMFGIEPFSDGDWFLLTITGKNGSGDATGIRQVYLADFRDGKQTILGDWQYVDLSCLGMVVSLEFTLSSSDMAPWGMNTPAYFVMDTILPEPATIVLFALGSWCFIGRKK